MSRRVEPQSQAAAAAREDGPVAVARRVLRLEAAALERIGGRIGPEFVAAVDALAGCPGKVVVVGLGKSGLVCRKIAATLASTGTPAFFLHAAEGLHGDLGMMTRGDCMLAVSHSGRTPELLEILPAARRLGLPIVAITGDPRSTLGLAADVVLDASVEAEACPHNLAPTASTTATMALGDALAIALLERRGFRPEDFGSLHPGGTLGRRLVAVRDLIHHDAELPRVGAGASLLEAVAEISAKGLGVTAVVGEDGRLLGVITDGDLRRAVQRGADLAALRAGDVMGRAPKTVPGGALAAAALAIMEEHKITALFVLDEAGRPAGVLHLHDLLRAGVV